MIVGEWVVLATSPPSLRTACTRSKRSPGQSGFIIGGGGAKRLGIYIDPSPRCSTRVPSPYCTVVPRSGREFLLLSLLLLLLLLALISY